MARASKTGVRGLFRDGSGRWRIDLRWFDRSGRPKRYQKKLPAWVSDAEATEVAKRALVDLVYLPQRPPRGIGVVYFVAIGDALKIGFTTNLPRRMSEYSTHNPQEPLLLATVAGTHADERRWQRRVKDHRLRGEFYSMTAWQPICEEINAGATHVEEDHDPR